jgi:hypothetical protein
MKNKSMVLVLALLAATNVWSGKPTTTANVVDAGSLGIFVGGRRVATEKFHIEQRGTNSTARSEITLHDGSSAQSAEMQLTSAGELRRYEWRELSPGKSRTVVEPKDEFLIERMFLGTPEKPLEQPFLMPASTVILDDYFFTHRQLLAWRYLASGCAPTAGRMECRLSRAQYGALVPRQQASLMVSMEYVGRERVRINGQVQNLIRLNLRSDNVDWALWLNDQYKLLRLHVPSENIEVVRD